MGVNRKTYALKNSSVEMKNHCSKKNIAPRKPSERHITESHQRFDGSSDNFPSMLAIQLSLVYDLIVRPKKKAASKHNAPSMPSLESEKPDSPGIRSNQTNVNKLSKNASRIKISVLRKIFCKAITHLCRCVICSTVYFGKRRRTVAALGRTTRSPILSSAGALPDFSGAPWKMKICVPGCANFNCT